MKKLILLRHGKSSWEDPALDDHDRPLNRRGKAAVPTIGAWLQNRHHDPDTVLCSSSKRTVETAERVGTEMSAMPQPVIEPELYHASPDMMLDRLRQLPETCSTVMMIGHQPGIGSLTRRLSNGLENRRCRRAFEHFPTAAAAVLEIDLQDWSGLTYTMASFIDFAKPRELMDA